MQTQSGQVDTARVNSVVVVGSLNLDVVIGLDRMPEVGETVLGSTLTRHAGGKGLNQAVAAARMGARVHMVGAVGEDEAGTWLRNIARDEGASTMHVLTNPGTSGTAVIEVAPNGANRIVVVPGANATVTPTLVEAAIAQIANPRVVLVQGEIPIDAVGAALRAGRARGALTMLNPAPVFDIPRALMETVDVIVPNEAETTALTGLPTTTRVDAAQAAAELVDRGARFAVVTCGARGAAWVSAAHGSGAVPAYAVRAIDTVAAGDAFCGALAAMLADGMAFGEALQWASAAGGLATTVAGAVPSLPSRAAVEALLGR